MNERDGFDRRLQDAETRQGVRQKAGAGGKPASPWGFGARAGVEVVSALGVGVAIGIGLDRWLGTFPWFFLLFFLAGAAAGVLNLYRLLAPRGGPGGKPGAGPRV